MKFSAIIQSYLGWYGGAAMDRENKLIRAVKSILDQTFQDFEIIVVADGCEQTFNIIRDTFMPHDKISVYLITKQVFWSGVPRTFGNQMAKGEYILYLDIDDRWGNNHLQIINDQLNGFDWVWFNDYRYQWRAKAFCENPCNIFRIGQNGTSNVCFKRAMNATWDFNGYSHDYYFNKSLIKSSNNFAKIRTPEYYVCHLPPHPGGRAYD